MQQQPDISIPPRNALYGLCFFSLVSLLAALLQVTSLWNYQGEQVDESELAYFAVGFFGGDLDPQWYGYGLVGMYFLFLLYLPIGVGSLLLGHSTSMVEFASLLFDSPLFILSGRVAYAALAVSAVLLYLRIGKQLEWMPFLLCVFFIGSLLQPDGLYYANFLRCDQIVGFFCALLLSACIAPPTDKARYFLIPIIIAFATATKTSALSLFIIVPLVALDKLPNWRHALAWLGIMTAVFLFTFSLLSPFVSLWSRIQLIFDVSILGPHLSYSKPVYSDIGERANAIFRIFADNISLPFRLALLSFPCMLLYRLERRILIFSLTIIVALTFPYLLSSEISSYWFIPAFPLTRFIAIAGIAALIKYFHRQVTSWGLVLRLSVIGFGLWIIFVGFYDYAAFIRHTTSAKRNDELAKKWLETEAMGHAPILLDTHYNHVLPRVYGTSDLAASKDISRAFLFERGKNPFLHEAFEYFLFERYKPSLNQSGVVVKKLSSFDPQNSETLITNFDGAFFVTSPAIYRRFQRNSGAHLSQEAKATISFVSKYYDYMLRFPLIKKFSSGSGAAIEIYKISREPNMPANNAYN